VRLLHPNTIFTARGMERTKFQPWGLDGGRAGAPGDCVLNPDAVTMRRLGKVNVERLSAGDVVSLRTPGGGYGDPMTRDVAKVLDHVLDGFISEDAAHALYGVVLYDSAIDVAATEDSRHHPAGEPPRRATISVWDARPTCGSFRHPFSMN
jgi:N-methylhydantoinase B